MKKLATKMYNGFSRTNINTDNSISLGFLIIGVALFVCSILSLVTPVEGVEPVVACLCSLGCFILGSLSSGFASALLRDYNKSIKEAGK